MKYSIKFDELNLYVCSLTLGLLQYMLHSGKYELGIWTLGVPGFRERLSNNDVDKRLMDIIDEFDEFSAMEELDIDVEGSIKNRISTILQIMDELQCSSVNQIRFEQL